MKGFRREKSMFVAEMDDVERRVISGVVADVAQLLGTDLRGEGAEESGAGAQSVEEILRGLTEEVGEPLDPALARLLPSAYDADEEAAGEFRRLTEGDIRQAKVGRLRNWYRALTGPGVNVYVPAAEAGEWAAALTDIRLVLASRLEIETEDDAEEVYAQSGPEGDSDDAYAQFALGQVYSALTWLQESLLAVMMRAK